MKYDITAMTSLLKRETDDVPVILVTITHPALNNVPIRVSTDNGDKLNTPDEYGNPVYGTISNGLEYIFCPMQITLPSQHGEEGNEATISIDNVSRQISPFVRKAQVRDGYPKIHMQFLLLSPDMPESKNIVVADYPQMNIKSVTMDQMKVSVSIAVSSLEGEAFPGRTFTPQAFPSLFGGIS